MSNNKEFQINYDIKDREIRVIDSDGSQLGILETSKALNIAFEKNLDLVKIASQAIPCVCKIMDFGKYKFELAKKEKESKKNQHIVELKEIRLSVNIDVHDLETKVTHAKKFIENGDKIKISIRFKGREMGHPEIGFTIMKKFAEMCSDFAVIEKSPTLDGRTMLMFFAKNNSLNKNMNKNSRGVETNAENKNA